MNNSVCQVWWYKPVMPGLSTLVIESESQKSELHREGLKKKNILDIWILLRIQGKLTDLPLAFYL